MLHSNLYSFPALVSQPEAAYGITAYLDKRMADSFPDIF